MTRPKPVTPARVRANSRRPRATDGKYVTKFTPQVRDAVLTAIRAGNYLETSAAYAGIHRDTFNEWLRQARAALEKPAAKRTPQERALIDFLAEVEQALAHAEVHDLAVVDKASAHIWQAAAWKLERRSPEKFGRRSRVDLGAEGAGEITIKLAFGGDDDAGG